MFSSEAALFFGMLSTLHPSLYSWQHICKILGWSLKWFRREKVTNKFTFEFIILVRIRIIYSTRTKNTHIILLILTIRGDPSILAQFRRTPARGAAALVGLLAATDLGGAAALAHAVRGAVAAALHGAYWRIRYWHVGLREVHCEAGTLCLEWRMENVMIMIKLLRLLSVRNSQVQQRKTPRAGYFH